MKCVVIHMPQGNYTHRCIQGCQGLETSVVSRPLFSLGLGLGLTVIGLGLGLGLMK